ncbi:unnamed protein product [Victoria cruziana]
MHVLDEIAPCQPHFAGANLSPVKKWVVRRKGIRADDEQFLGVGSSLCRALRWRKARCSSFSSIIFSSRLIPVCRASSRTSARRLQHRPASSQRAFSSKGHPRQCHVQPASGEFQQHPWCRSRSSGDLQRVSIRPASFIF